MAEEQKTFKDTFQEVMLKLAVGDVLTSRKGILFKGNLSGDWYRSFKHEYRGDGVFISHKKERAEDVKQVNNDTKKVSGKD